MKRYISIAAGWDHDLGDTIHMPDSCTVYETEKGPQPTGLLDLNGIPLYRISPTVRFGFHTKD